MIRHSRKWPHAAIIVTLSLSSAWISLHAEERTVPKLHPKKEYCIHYKHFGDFMKGTSVKCSRQHGQISYEIKKLEVGMAGFTQQQYQHAVTTPDKVIQWDPSTLVGTEIENPMKEVLAKRTDEDVETFTRKMYEALGFEPDGTQQTIASRVCNNLSSPHAGKMCMTEDGLVLKQQMAGTGMIATEVHDNGGDPKNYEVPANVKITDHGNLQELLRGQRR